MTDLLSRYAECLFWFGRYTERTTCLARLIEVQTSFDRGLAGAATRWSWMLTLYDDQERFAEHYEQADTDSVIRFYVSDRENPGSIVSCVFAARENARTLRSLISTDLWHQVNAFYNRFRNLPPASLSDTRLSQTCQMVKKECYAQLGVAAATLYRDEAWHFYQLGALVERADQMSRLLDVRFAQMRGVSEGSGKPLGDFGFWSVLLRSAAAQQAYLRSNAGRRDPASVARFLIFDTGLPRSIALCVAEMDRLVNELRTEYDLRGAAPALERIDGLKLLLDEAREDDGLIDELHQFNDRIQSSLIELANELAIAFFGTPRSDIYPDEGEKSDQAGVTGSGQSQSQSQRAG